MANEPLAGDMNLSSALLIWNHPFHPTKNREQSPHEILGLDCLNEKTWLSKHNWTLASNFEKGDSNQGFMNSPLENHENFMSPGAFL